MNKKDLLKLIYVNKVGINTKGQGIYEFVFSKDTDNVLDDEWGWNVFPARNNAQPPEDNYVDEIYEFRTDLFNLKCLHELNDRCYLDGYYKIHAIAFEDSEFKNKYGVEFNDVLVFHYGNTLAEVENKLYKRDIISDDKKKEFVQARDINFKNKKEEQTDGLLF